MVTDAYYGCARPVAVDRAIGMVPTLLIHATTSRGSVAFCDRCFERRNFRDLTVEDIETLTWCFGGLYVDDEPARAVTLLEPLLDRWRSPETCSLRSGVPTSGSDGRRKGRRCFTKRSR
jgi:hypothetical protein